MRYLPYRLALTSILILGLGAPILNAAAVPPDAPRPSSVSVGGPAERQLESQVVIEGANSPKQQQRLVEHHYREATRLAEEHNGLKVEIEWAKRELSSLRRDTYRQEIITDGARQLITSSIVDQYVSNMGVSTTVQILFADSPQEFLTGLTTADLAWELFEERESSYSANLKSLQLREEAVGDYTAKVQSLEEEAAARLTEAEEELSIARAHLRNLKEEARRSEIASVMLSSLSAPKVSHDFDFQEEKMRQKVKPVLNYAVKQLGDPYVWGASGPQSFDCSGLTLAAWREAGVALPHSSRLQATLGSPVQKEDLQPGDLVFYYSPVSHVGIYLGGGKIVHAARPGVGVVVAEIDSMPLTTIRRVG